jgi:phosphinothricin acetyltransferase
MPKSENPQIRLANLSDTGAIAGIYNNYILNTAITFEEEPIARQVFADRLAAVLSASLPWLVIVSGEQVAGFAYASPWKDRRGYRFSVESSIYLESAIQGRGLGTLLYSALLDHLRQLPVHTVIGGIALPNAASVRLHEKLGFTKVAHFSEAGYKFKRWIDVGYWQLLLPLSETG